MRVLLAALFLLLVAPAAGGEPQIPKGVLEAAWNIACGYTPSARCDEMELPAIGFTQLSTPGRIIEGVAVPGAVILDYHMIRGLMDPTNVDPYAFGVLLHEMVHVLDFATVGIDSNASLCASEGRAWWVHNDWMSRNGLNHLTNWDWRRAYPHCSASN